MWCAIYSPIFFEEPGLYAARMGAGGGTRAVEEEARRARIVCDYIAGMTDRYALAEHPRLFDVTPELR